MKMAHSSGTLASQPRVGPRLLHIVCRFPWLRQCTLLQFVLSKTLEFMWEICHRSTSRGASYVIPMFAHRSVCVSVLVLCSCCCSCDDACSCSCSCFMFVLVFIFLFTLLLVMLLSQYPCHRCSVGCVLLPRLRDQRCERHHKRKGEIHVRSLNFRSSTV